MEWKLSQDTKTVKNSSKASFSEREKPTLDFGRSERNVPHPQVAWPEQSQQDLVDHHAIDRKNTLNPTQIWSNQRSRASNQVYCKIYCKHSQQINLSYFAGENGTVPTHLAAHFQTILKQYFRRYPHAIYENIWFSQETQKMFSNAQTYCTGLDPIAHSFCTTETNFINQTWTGLSSEMGRMIEDLVVGYNGLGQRPNAWGVTGKEIDEGKCYGDIVTRDFRIGLCPAVNAMLNQDSVLIVGGGPSTNNIDFSKYRDIPVWTMNNYYQNPVFDQFSNIQVACFLDEVDVFDNEELWKHVNDRDTVVLQEITDYGKQRIHKIRDTAKYSTYFHTRYRSKLGVGPRLMVTAMNLGIKNIYFCGFDGYDIGSEDNHSFESGKAIPNWMKNSENPAALQRDQFVMLWDYLLNTVKWRLPCKITDISAGQSTLQYAFLEDAIR